MTVMLSRGIMFELGMFFDRKLSVSETSPSNCSTSFPIGISALLPFIIIDLPDSFYFSGDKNVGDGDDNYKDGSFLIIVGLVIAIVFPTLKFSFIKPRAFLMFSRYFLSEFI